ncbi:MULTISPECIES: VOC family protein [unclassified Streptomyces]|uniref:VOC family protein n=1 Tax=unclassified Streptomyces TaxID=2593676 RepID=UPI00278BB8E7|nr:MULTISPECIES: VOC family protein [unclassified Streptomyces]
MITGTHTILYSADAEADRAFFRDVLGFPHVDAGGGWLIFAAPPSEIALHPTEDAPKHELMLMCDDVHRTVAELKEKGVVFTQPISTQRWGHLTAFRLPSGTEVGLYEPLHPVAHG